MHQCSLQMHDRTEEVGIVSGPCFPALGSPPDPHLVASHSPVAGSYASLYFNVNSSYAAINLTACESARALPTSCVCAPELALTDKQSKHTADFARSQLLCCVWPFGELSGRSGYHRDETPYSRHDFQPLHAQRRRITASSSQLAALSAGPSANVEIQLKTRTSVSGKKRASLQSLYINLNATVSFQSLTQMLGIQWPFSSDVLAISNPAFRFVANPQRLEFAATITIPFLSFKNRATLIVDGQNSYGVSVRDLLCCPEPLNCRTPCMLTCA